MPIESRTMPRGSTAAKLRRNPPDVVSDPATPPQPLRQLGPMLQSLLHGGCHATAKNGKEIAGFAQLSESLFPRNTRR
jgi:hypothetical protein